MYTCKTNDDSLQCQIQATCPSLFRPVVSFFKIIRAYVQKLPGSFVSIIVESDIKTTIPIAGDTPGSVAIKISMKLILALDRTILVV